MTGWFSPTQRFSGLVWDGVCTLLGVENGPRLQHALALLLVDGCSSPTLRDALGSWEAAGLPPRHRIWDHLVVRKRVDWALHSVLLPGDSRLTRVAEVSEHVETGVLLDVLFDLSRRRYGPEARALMLALMEGRTSRVHFTGAVSYLQSLLDLGVPWSAGLEEFVCTDRLYLLPGEPPPPRLLALLGEVVSDEVVEVFHQLVVDGTDVPTALAAARALTSV